jgi:tRNA(Ile)-lysidine synthase
MIARLQKYIEEEQLLTAADKVLLTVSGGKDSVAMALLFAQLDYPFAIAHCNFQLRGAESDADESFVKELAARLKVPFFCRSFDTSAYAQEQSVSIQMAARQLRYEWFEDLAKMEGYSKIATAHHQDDAIETLLIKKSRKASLEGLRGVVAKRGNIVRPLLCFSAQEIADYMQCHDYREDSSNASTAYQRNKIRLEQLPAAVKEDPDLREKLLQEIKENQKRYEALLLEVQRIREDAWQEQHTHHTLKLASLVRHPEREELLYELLKAYAPLPWEDVFRLIEAKSGKYIENERYRLIKDRGQLLISERKARVQDVVMIEEEQQELQQPYRWTFSTIARAAYQLSSSPLEAALDKDKLSFPLELRLWKAGDRFVPLGMKGHKKISDFLIDQKCTQLEKEQTWVLSSAGEIVWVVGQRIDERYKLVAETEKVYLVQPF